MLTIMETYLEAVKTPIQPSNNPNIQADSFANRNPDRYPYSEPNK
jgi:hypothetical protein